MDPMSAATTTDPGRNSAPYWQVPPLERENSILGGVAHALAAEIGVQPLVIRAAFLLLGAAGGWGLIVYAAIWLVLSTQAETRIAYVPHPKAESTTHRHVGVGLIVAGLLIFFRSVNTLVSEQFSSVVSSITWPVGFIFVGALIAWSQSRNSQEGISTIARVVSGIVVGVGGLLAFGAFSFSPRDGLLALVFSLAIVTGIGVIAAPSIMRIGVALDDERKERVRADEKARLAAHLHDSVLQTLTLIQRHADDPSTTAQLARRQERELRNWLYEPTPDVGTISLQTALQDIATVVEADHRVPIEVVVVGDVAMEAQSDERFDALMGATREAMINAAKHSGTARIDVYAELRAGAAELFIRDTGKGFDPAMVDLDRRGIAESINARMKRAGGSAHVFSSPGDGSEVELRIELTGTPTESEQ